MYTLLNIIVPYIKKKNTPYFVVLRKVIFYVLIVICSLINEIISFKKIFDKCYHNTMKNT